MVDTTDPTTAGPFSFATEPTVEEMLEDPIVQMVMTRDRVRTIDIQQLIARMRLRRSTLDAGVS